MANSYELKRAKEFELSVINYFNSHSSHSFSKRKVDLNGVMFEFDLVSDDGEIIGDAKFLKNIKVPAAKWDNISHYVWLLEHSRAKIKFMVFGNDREVPERYLKRFEPLTGDVEFYFFNNECLEPLGSKDNHRLESILLTK